MGLLGFQAVFIGLAPFGVLVALDDVRELWFGDDVGAEIELNTVLIAALFGFMAAVCVLGVVFLHRRRSSGAQLGVVVGAYFVYVGAVPALLIDRTDFLFLDVPRGVAMIVIGVLLNRRLDFPYPATIDRS
jgi:hypothetical protein